VFTALTLEDYRDYRPQTVTPWGSGKVRRYGIPTRARMLESKSFIASLLYSVHLCVNHGTTADDVALARKWMGIMI